VSLLLFQWKLDITPKRTYLWSIPLFLVTLAASAAAIFNYQRSSSSVVSSTLYALRVNPQVRELLGDEIQFKAKIPWITGTMDQMHGRIDISYAVKGTKNEGIVYFKSTRHGGKQGLVRYIVIFPPPFFGYCSLLFLKNFPLRFPFQHYDLYRTGFKSDSKANDNAF